MAKISEVGRSKTQDTPPDHGTNTEHDPLLEGQPVEYIKHVGRCMLCYGMLCYVMVCYVMLFYGMVWYVVLCYVMLQCMSCYIMLCYVGPWSWPERSVS